MSQSLPKPLVQVLVSTGGGGEEGGQCPVDAIPRGKHCLGFRCSC